MWLSILLLAAKTRRALLVALATAAPQVSPQGDVLISWLMFEHTAILDLAIFANFPFPAAE